AMPRKCLTFRTVHSSRSRDGIPTALPKCFKSAVVHPTNPTGSIFNRANKGGVLGGIAPRLSDRMHLPVDSTTCKYASKEKGIAEGSWRVESNGMSGCSGRLAK